MLDDQLLEQYIHTFYGYGNYHGSFWFIGKEEGGGKTIGNIIQRLNIWSQRGCRELEDLCEYRQAFGGARRSNKRPAIQRSWGKLIRSLLKAEGQKVSNEQIRKYQEKYLAIEKGESCLLELLPLPSPNTGKWLYSNHSQLPQLRRREFYRDFYVAQRANHIRQRILEHQPRAVVFYSADSWYQPWWKAIAEGVHFSTHEHGFQWGTDGSTLFVIAKHPTRHGVTNQYFEAIGGLIGAHS